MILPIVTALVFLVTVALLMSMAYFLIQVPLEKQKLRTRIAAVQQASLHDGATLESDIMRRELLSSIPAISRLLSDVPSIIKLQLFLEQGAVRMQVFSFLMAVAALAFASWLIAVALNAPFGAAFLLAGVSASIPFVVVAYMRQRRFARFEEQFPEAMEMLARAVRAGHAFTTAFALISEEMADPIAEEFRTTYRQQNLGLPLRDALGNMAVRVPLPDVRIFVSGLQIQRDSGGNLGEILDNLAYVMRERFKILREVQVLTAEGRLSMYILTAMPFVAAILMFFGNREYLMTLFEDPLGTQMIAAAVVMQTLGYIIIRRMIRIKV